MKEWKIEIKVVLPDDVLEHDLRLLLTDAIGEFLNWRGPTAKEYVDRRYPLPQHAQLNRAEKIAHVERRCAWAQAILDASWLIGNVEVVPRGGEIADSRECAVTNCAVHTMVLVEHQGEMTLDVLWRDEKLPICGACEQFVRNLAAKWLPLRVECSDE